jgi:hypothetical protein
MAEPQLIVLANGSFREADFLGRPNTTNFGFDITDWVKLREKEIPLQDCHLVDTVPLGSTTKTHYFTVNRTSFGRKPKSERKLIAIRDTLRDVIDAGRRITEVKLGLDGDRYFLIEQSVGLPWTKNHGRYAEQTFVYSPLIHLYVPEHQEHNE